MHIKRIKGWWTVGGHYYQLRGSALERIFAFLDRMRCRFVEERRPQEPPEPDAAAKALGEKETYLGEGPYNRFALKRGKCVLATLVMYTADWPWTSCHCTFTEAYETVRPEFARFLEAAQSMKTPEEMRAWHRARRRIRRLGLKLAALERPRHRAPTPILLYIDGEKARYRVSRTPNMSTWPW